MEINAVVLAATDNVNMCSDSSKFVHPIAGKPLIRWIRDALHEAGADEQLYVVGKHYGQIRSVMGEEVAYVMQENPQGTAHAVCQASSFLEGRKGITFIVPGNTPLISGATLKAMAKRFVQEKFHALVMTAVTKKVEGFDRVVKNAKGELISILKEEHSEALPPAGLGVEVVAAVYCFDTALLLSMLGRLGSYVNLEKSEYRDSEGEEAWRYADGRDELSRAKREQAKTVQQGKAWQEEAWTEDVQEEVPQESKKKGFSFAEIVKIMSIEGYKLGTHQVPFDEIIKVNNRFGLEQARLSMSWRICKRHMAEGVTIMDPASTRIDATVKIGQDSEISPGSTLKGDTMIGSHVRISRSCSLENVHIGDYSVLEASNIKDSYLGSHVHIGPFSSIAENTTLADGVKVQSFCSILHSQIGEGCEVQSHASLENARLGQQVVIGSKATICSGDNREAWTHIGEHAYIGPHVCMLAPLDIKEHAYIAASTTLSRNVPAYALVVGRTIQETKKEWVRDRYKREKRVSEKEAMKEAENFEHTRIQSALELALDEAVQDLRYAQEKKRQEESKQGFEAEIF